MLKIRLPVLLLTSLLVASCVATTPSRVADAPPSTLQVPPARLQPAPEAVMVPRPANYRQQLEDVFWQSATLPTTPPASSPPARP